MRNLVLGSLMLIVALASGLYYYTNTSPPRPVALEPPSIMMPSSKPAKGGRYMFNITLHTPKEISALLTRAEQLAKTTRLSDNSSGIALVLHGPEVEIFAKKNYAQYKKLVDQAARLDADGVIEIKMCETTMRARNIKDEDIPGFIEFVPFGPAEIERLKREGYVSL